MPEAVYSQEDLLQAELAKLRVERSQMAAQMGGPFTGLDPNFHYSWIVNESRSRTMAQARGFEVVRSTVGKNDFGELVAEDGVSSGWLREDGTHVYVENILMRMPKVRYDAEKLLAAQDSAEKLREAKSREGIRQVGASLGIPVTIPQEE